MDRKRESSGIACRHRRQESQRRVWKRGEIVWCQDLVSVGFRSELFAGLDRWSLEHQHAAAGILAHDVLILDVSATLTRSKHRDEVNITHRTYCIPFTVSHGWRRGTHLWVYSMYAPSLSSNHHAPEWRHRLDRIHQKNIHNNTDIRQKPFHAPSTHRHLLECARTDQVGGSKRNQAYSTYHRRSQCYPPSRLRAIGD